MICVICGLPIAPDLGAYGGHASGELKAGPVHSTYDCLRLLKSRIAELQAAADAARALAAQGRPPRIYVAGPYTAGDIVVNVRNAIDAGDAIATLGGIPFVPHLSHFHHLVHARPWQFWIDQDLQWLHVCDALLRLPGDSLGADLEVAEARRLVIPVLTDLPQVDSFIARWRQEGAPA